jgi:predicted phage-related endonuclease
MLAGMKPEHLIIGGRAIDRYPIEGRDMWLALRQQDVTASAAGALLGGHPYISAYGLWALKSGRIKEDSLETPAMRRGRLLEPVAVELLREERPDWEIHRGTAYYRDAARRIGATPDALAIDTTGRLGVIQIKSVEPTIFRRNWQGEEGVEPPLWIALQAMIESELTGAVWAVVAAMTISHGIEIHIVEIDLTHREAIMARLTEAVADFWRTIAAGIMPDIDYGRDLALVEQLYVPSGETIDLTRDNAVMELVSERGALGKTIKEAEARLTGIKGALLDKLGSASIGLLPDGRALKAARLNRKAYTVPASTYLQLRILNRKPDDES